MSNFFLIDDDRAVLSILKIIIEKNDLGNVCGMFTDPNDALDELSHTRPDIIIVDLLMPELDGISFIKKSSEKLSNVSYIMLSQVSSKDMIEKAYDAGIEFFIQKPVNSIEVVNVINRVKSFINMDRTYKKIYSIFQSETEKNNPSADTLNGISVLKPMETKITSILHRLGIGGDPASKDICTIVCHIVQNGLDNTKPSISDLCSLYSQSPKSMEQRMRRAVSQAMTNIVHMGLEDYNNDVFSEYANVLFQFEQIKKEMDYLRGKSSQRGKVSLRNFIYALSDIIYTY